MRKNDVIREKHVKFVKAIGLLKDIEHAVYIYTTGKQLGGSFITRVEGKIANLPNLIETVNEHVRYITDELKAYSLERYGNVEGKNNKDRRKT